MRIFIGTSLDGVQCVEFKNLISRLFHKHGFAFHSYYTISGKSCGLLCLERLKLLQGDPVINEFANSIEESETVSKILGDFSHHMLLEVWFETKNQPQSLQKAVEKEQAQVSDH